jgi:tetratricopeptide (TPR) repeat protein
MSGGEVLPFPTPVPGVNALEAGQCAEAFLSCPHESRSARLATFLLDQPEVMLAVCHLLEKRMDSSPAPVAEAADFAYEQIARSERGAYLFDEREYYLGELALLAGTASRILHHLDDARSWFDRSQAWFLLTTNSHADVARVSYQRLGLAMEQRQLSDVLHLAPPLRESFTRAGAMEMALKCSYLEGIALREADRISESRDVFEQICEDARALRSTRMLATGLVALVQLYSDLGLPDRALEMVSEAEPLLKEVDNRVALGKLYWGIGLLLRTQNRLPEAIEAFRAAQQQMLRLELPAESAALHLVIADLLLELGQDRQAEREIRAALPVIDELKMVPEGFAAMSLLRGSLRRRSVDRHALRTVHGYFEEMTS